MAVIAKFQTAKRIACKASIMIEGLSGRGKSGLALALAKGLTEKWEDIFVIDTENNSAQLFAGIPSSTGEVFGEFQVAQLTKEEGFKPTNYLAYREVAKGLGAKVVVEDSISHAWMYQGGVLDIVSQKQKNAKDKYAAWGDEDVVKEKNELLSLIRDDKIHVITTVRVKEKLEYDKEDGKTVLKSLGDKQIMQDDLKYEPDLVITMISPGSNKHGVIKHPTVRVIKSRYAIFEAEAEYEFTPDLIQQLRSYLEDGADPEQLLAIQKNEYILAIKNYIANHANAKAIWKVLTTDAGYEGKKADEIPLNTLKLIYIQMTS